MAKLQRSVQTWIDRRVVKSEIHEQEQLPLLQQASLQVCVERAGQGQGRRGSRIESGSAVRRRGRSKSRPRGPSTASTSFSFATAAAASVHEDHIKPQHSALPHTPTRISALPSAASALLTLSDLVPVTIPPAEAEAADAALDNFALRYCRKEPSKYLHLVGM